MRRDWGNELWQVFLLRWLANVNGWSCGLPLALIIIIRHDRRVCTYFVLASGNAVEIQVRGFEPTMIDCRVIYSSFRAAFSQNRARRSWEAARVHTSDANVCLKRLKFSLDNVVCHFYGNLATACATGSLPHIRLLGTVLAPQTSNFSERRDLFRQSEAKSNQREALNQFEGDSFHSKFRAKRKRRRKHRQTRMMDGPRRCKSSVFYNFL